MHGHACLVLLKSPEVHVYCLCSMYIICLELARQVPGPNLMLMLGNNAQVQSGLFGSDLEKVSEYGVDKGSPSVAPVCLLYSGNHYDLLVTK